MYYPLSLIKRNILTWFLTGLASIFLKDAYLISFKDAFRPFPLRVFRNDGTFRLYSRITGIFTFFVDRWVNLEGTGFLPGVDTSLGRKSVILVLLNSFSFLFSYNFVVRTYMVISLLVYSGDLC